MTSLSKYLFAGRTVQPPYDLIVLSHVRYAQSPRGMMFVEVPNSLEKTFRRENRAPHISFFATQTLTAMIRKLGEKCCSATRADTIASGNTEAWRC